MSDADLPPVLTDRDERIAVGRHGPFHRRVASTMWAPGMAAWSDVTVIRERSPRRILAAACQHEALIMDGSNNFRDARWLVTGAFGQINRLGPELVIAGALWEPEIASLTRLGRHASAVGIWAKRAVLRSFDHHRVTYCVLSREELDSLPRLWGIAPERVRCTPYHFALWGIDPDEAGESTRDPYFFAGGNPLRDYPTLIEAARGLPWPVHIATTSRLGPLPPNVTVASYPHDRYMQLMRDAAAIVVPLAATVTRSSGQQTYLNAMALGKPLIITDAMGVRDYVVDGRTGIIVPTGDPMALRDALVRTINEHGSERLAALGANAKRVVREHLGPAQYWERLRTVAEDLAAARDR